jgi:hypothetical protein
MNIGKMTGPSPEDRGSSVSDIGASFEPIELIRRNGAGGIVVAVIDRIARIALPHPVTQTRENLQPKMRRQSNLST